MLNEVCVDLSLENFMFIILNRVFLVALYLSMPFFIYLSLCEVIPVKTN